MQLYAELAGEPLRSITVRSVECGLDLAVVSMMTLHRRTQLYAGQAA